MEPDTDVDQTDDQDTDDQDTDQPVDITTVGDLVPLRVQELREEAERERARALLAETPEAKASLQESFKALEAHAEEIEEWGQLDANDPLLPGTAVLTEIGRRDAAAAKAAAEEARQAALTEEERQAEVAAAAAAEAEAKDHAERVAAVEALASEGMVRAIHPLTGRITLVSENGRMPAALKPISDLKEELVNIPVPQRDAWWDRRTTIELDALSVLYGIYPPVSLSEEK
jgi:hypothetical protein